MGLSPKAAFAIMQGFKADGILGALSDDIQEEIKASCDTNFIPYKTHIRVWVGEYAPAAAEYAWNKQWKQAQLFLIKHGFQKELSDTDLQRARGSCYRFEQRKSKDTADIKNLHDKYKLSHQWGTCK